MLIRFLPICLGSNNETLNLTSADSHKTEKIGLVFYKIKQLLKEEGVAISCRRFSEGFFHKKHLEAGI